MKAKEIKKLRHRLGLTAKQLASALGVTENTVNRWENNWRVCRGPAVKAMRLMVKAQLSAQAE